jgi:uncharacterized membrane protein
VYSSNDRARRALATAPWLAYPLVVWAGLSLSGPRVAASLVLVALAARTLPLWRSTAGAARRQLLVPLAAATAPAAGAAWLDDPLLLLFVPALVSLGLLFAFARSLWRGPPLIETLARLQVGALSVAEQRYCRGVTAVWCVFFAANASVAGWLALWGSTRAWALWTGALSYVAIAVLFTLELGVRSWRFRRYSGAPTDWLMRRLFPPRA